MADQVQLLATRGDAAATAPARHHTMLAKSGVLQQKAASDLHFIPSKAALRATGSVLVLRCGTNTGTAKPFVSSDVTFRESWQYRQTQCPLPVGASAADGGGGSTAVVAPEGTMQALLQHNIMTSGCSAAYPPPPPGAV